MFLWHVVEELAIDPVVVSKFEHNGRKLAKEQIFKFARFCKLNQYKFGYQRFDFLYLEDSKKNADNIFKLNNKINQFFND